MQTRKVQALVTDDAVLDAVTRRLLSHARPRREARLTRVSVGSPRLGCVHFCRVIGFS